MKSLKGEYVIRSVINWSTLHNVDADPDQADPSREVKIQKTAGSSLQYTPGTYGRPLSYIN